MDPTVALWVLGSIAVGFIALLPIVFLIITFLIPRFAREYSTKEELIADIGIAAFKILSRTKLGKIDKIGRKDIQKILMKTRAGGLLMGTYAGFFFFVGSIGLVSYCLFVMMLVEMGSDFPSILVSAAVSWAIVLLVILVRRVGMRLEDIIVEEFAKAFVKFIEREEPPRNSKKVKAEPV